MLPNDQGQSGASRRPPETADASSHGGTSPTPGHLDLTAALAPATAATASANAVTIAAGGTGSTPAPTSNAVNTTRTASARPAKRRSQPRTVSTGRPTAAATVRAPAPAAFAASAAPITVTTSARRSRANTGRRTCDCPHERQRDRRGRTAAPPRSTRTRAQPHGPSEPPQPGHASSPLTSRSSTRAASAPTVSTAPPRATRPSRDASAKRDTGRAFACPHRHGAAAHQHHTITGTHQDPSAPTMPGNHPQHRHPQRRSTAALTMLGDNTNNRENLRQEAPTDGLSMNRSYTCQMYERLIDGSIAAADSRRSTVDRLTARQLAIWLAA